jgi:hypothetical protein
MTDVVRSPETARRLGSPMLVGGALVAGCVALRIVDPAGGPPICPFKAWTGLDCPGCGATRAAHQLLNGHVGAALSLNAAFVLAVPLVLWWLGARLVPMVRGRTLPAPNLGPTVLKVMIAALLVFSVVRNLPVSPFAWLGTGT